MNTTILHLALISGVGPALIARIIQKVPADQLHKIYQWSVHDFQHMCLVTEQQALRVVHGLADYSVLEQELHLLEQTGVAIITLLDDAYPAQLRDIHLPPAVLYIQGTLSLSQKAVAVVGSRQANAYAATVIQKMVPELVSAGVGIVSGGAIGADSLAHKTALQAGGNTIAVVGSGLLNPYPASNKKLFERIIQAGGALVSPFSLKTEPLPGNFPARNRIIAGISDACLVVQAAAKSGAKITAQCALEQGKDVFAIPGAITDPLSAGCHVLIKQGATLVDNAHDILESLGFALVQQNNVSKRTHENASKQNASNACVHNIAINAGLSVAQDVQTLDPALSLKEKIRFLCAQPILFDELVTQSQADVISVQDALFELQLEGAVTQQLSGLWSRV